MSQAAPHYYSLGESAVALALPAPATWRNSGASGGWPPAWRAGRAGHHPGMNNLTVSYHPLDFDPTTPLTACASWRQARADDDASAAGGHPGVLRRRGRP